MFEGRPPRDDDEDRDSLEEFYLDLVTQIHRKEEIKLLAYPNTLSERLQLLSRFSRAVRDVARVLDERFNDRDEPGGTSQLNLDDFLHTDMFSDQHIPDTADTGLDSMPTGTETSLAETSACCDIVPNLSGASPEGILGAMESPVRTLDPRNLFQQHLERQPLGDHINGAVSPINTNGRSSSARKGRSKATAGESPAFTKRVSKPNKGLAYSSDSLRHDRALKHSTEDWDLPFRLARAIASPVSLHQLKRILQVTRSSWSSNDAPLPESTRGLWQYLHSLDNTSLGTSLRLRVASYHLKLRHESLILQLKNRNKGVLECGGDLRTEVIDVMLAEESDKDQNPLIQAPPLTRDTLKDKLHNAKVWHTLCQSYSPGILLLIPIKSEFRLSNSKIEKMTSSRVEACLAYISEHREHIVQQAALRATEIMPLFEGKHCATVLKLEDNGEDPTSQDTGDTNLCLELLRPKC